MSNIFTSGPMDPQTGQRGNTNANVSPIQAAANDGFNADVFSRFTNSNTLYKPRWSETGATKWPVPLRELCSSCRVVKGDYNPAVEMVFDAKADFPGGKITVDLEPSSQSMCRVGDPIDINWVVIVELSYTGPADKQPVNDKNEPIQTVWRIRLDKPVQQINSVGGMFSAFMNSSLSK